MTDFAANDVEAIAARMKVIAAEKARAQAEADAEAARAPSYKPEQPKQESFFPDTGVPHHGHALRLEAFRRWRTEQGIE